MHASGDVVDGYHRTSRSRDKQEKVEVARYSPISLPQGMKARAKLVPTTCVNVGQIDVRTVRKGDRV